ncbi:MAG TPA: hypothetical protein VF691_06375 [Cytophagaceae bacterium]|jgi:hypothetical protein
MAVGFVAATYWLNNIDCQEGAVINNVSFRTAPLNEYLKIETAK